MIGLVDEGCVGALVLLDLSAASDIVGHPILMEVPRQRFGVDANALGRVAEFVRYRGVNSLVLIGLPWSLVVALQFGVLQGSVLDWRIFIEYADDVLDIFHHHGIRHQLFAECKAVMDN